MEPVLQAVGRWRSPLASARFPTQSLCPRAALEWWPWLNGGGQGGSDTPPSLGPSLRPLDLEFMKHLSKVVNIIPVIAKADTMTLEEKSEFKQRVRRPLLLFLSAPLLPSSGPSHVLSLSIIYAPHFPPSSYLAIKEAGLTVSVDEDKFTASGCFLPSHQTYWQTPLNT